MSILLVQDYGGPALAYALPALRARGCVTLYVPRPERWDASLLGVPDNGAVTVVLDDSDWDRADEDEAVRRITAVAQRARAGAVLTFSELWSVPAARAAQELGLRGASPTGARRARDKLLMRRALAEVGFGTPVFRAVEGPEDVAAVLRATGSGGVVVKPRKGMSAVGIRLVEHEDETAQVLRESLAGYASFGVPADSEQALLAEGLLRGDARGWHVRPGLGDQVSVEGLVVGGTYVPVGITDVLPKVPPFTQSAHVSPTSLTLEGQRIVLDTARRAVEALGLGTCGTHVELKLMADSECAVVEIAARYPGRAIVDQTDRAYGTDLVGRLADALLDDEPVLPAAYTPTLADPRGAAATLHLYASEYLDGRPLPFAYEGMSPCPSALLDVSVRVKGFDERPYGWTVQATGDEQPHWIARLYLEGDSVEAVCASVNRVRYETRLLCADGAGRP